MVLDFTPQLLQEIYDLQELLKPKNTRAALSRDPLLLCGLACRVLVFWAEILGVIQVFHPDFEYYAETEDDRCIHDWGQIPEHLDVEALGRTVAFEEPRIWVESDDILWTVIVLDTRYTGYYTQLSQFANQLSQGRRHEIANPHNPGDAHG